MSGSTPISKNKPYPIESKLANEMELLIHTYDERLSLVAVLGVIEVVKYELIKSGVYDE